MDGLFGCGTLSLSTLLGGLPAWPSAGTDRPYGLDHEARLADIAASGGFTDVSAEQRAWTLVLDPGQVRALYGLRDCRAGGEGSEGGESHDAQAHGMFLQRAA